jgi:hypothetical protein
MGQSLQYGLNGPTDMVGNGVPANAMVAGSTYRNSAGGINTFYVNTNGQANGWVPLVLANNALITGGSINNTTITGATVTATGAPTARSLGDLFADIPNMFNNGIVADGVTNVSTAMLNYVSSLAGSLGSIFAPAGKYVITYGGNITHPPGLISFGTAWLNEMPNYFGANDGTQLGYSVPGVSKYGHAFGVFRNLDDIYGQSVAIIQGIDAPNVGTSSYKKSGLYVSVQTQVPSGYPNYTKDIVAITGYGNISNNNPQGRTWGGNLVAVVQAGSDGLATGLELDIVNNSSYQPALSTVTSKVALTIYNLGTQNSTAGILIGDGFHYGLVFSQPSSAMQYCWALNVGNNFPAYLDYNGNISATGLLLSVAEFNGTGNTQATATLLTAYTNIATFVPGNSGAILPSGITLNTRIQVVNRGSNNLLVYPPSGQQIENFGTNNAVSVAPGANYTFVYVGISKWFQFT